MGVQCKQWVCLQQGVLSAARVKVLQVAAPQGLQAKQPIKWVWGVSCMGLVCASDTCTDTSLPVRRLPCPAQVRMHEMRESLRIIYQCLNEMPEGPYKSIDGKVAPPR